jgi:hypothetical protein
MSARYTSTDKVRVKVIKRTRKQMEDEIEKGAVESTKPDHYTCPLGYSHESKKYVNVHKRHVLN